MSGNTCEVNRVNCWGCVSVGKEGVGGGGRAARGDRI